MYTVHCTLRSAVHAVGWILHTHPIAIQIALNAGIAAQLGKCRRYHKSSGEICSHSPSYIILAHFLSFSLSASIFMSLFLFLSLPFSHTPYEFLRRMSKTPHLSIWRIFTPTHQWGKKLIFCQCCQKKDKIKEKRRYYY